MATAATGRVARKTRKARTGGTVQASTNYVSSNSDVNTTHDLQVQYLRAHAFASASLAATIATLAWGVHHG